MANGGAAYKALQVPKDGISQGLQYWGGIKAQENAAEKLATERGEVRAQERYDKKVDTLSGEALQGVMVNQKNVDDVTKNYATQATDLAVDFERKAIESLDKGDEVGFKVNKDKSNKVRASFKTYATLLESIKPQLEDYMSNIDQYNPNDKRYKLYDAMIKNNVMPTVDNDGNLKLIMGLDKDGDGKISDEEKGRANEYIRGGAEVGDMDFEEIDPHDLMNGFYEQYKKVPITEKDGLLDQLASNIGMVTQDENSGSYVVNTTSGFDETKLKDLKDLTRLKLQDPATLAWVMNSGLGIKDKVEGFTDKEVEQAVDFITKQTIAKYPTTESSKFLSGKYSSDSSAAAARDRTSKTDELVEAEPMTDTDGNLIVGSYTLKSKSGKPIKGIMENDPKAEVLAIKDEGGKYLAQVRAEPTDLLESSFDGGTKTEWIELNTTELNRISRYMKVKTAGDLNTYLQGRAAGYKAGNTNSDPLGLGI